MSTITVNPLASPSEPRELSKQLFFISYSRKDHARASGLRRLIQLCGANVFMDEDTPAGERWKKWIMGNLLRSDIVVVLWTRAAEGSEWVRREYEAAMARDGCRVVAIRGDSTPPPAKLAERQMIDGLPLLNSVLHEQEELLSKGIPPAAVAGRITRMLQDAGIHVSVNDRRAIRSLFVGSNAPWYAIATLLFTLGTSLAVWDNGRLVTVEPSSTSEDLEANDKVRPPQSEVDECISGRDFEALRRELEVCSVEFIAGIMAEQDTQRSRMTSAVVDGPDFGIVKIPGSIRFNDRIPRHPSVRQASPDSRSAEREKEIRSILRSRLEEMRYCLVKAQWSEFPRAGGRLTLGFTVDSKGYVRDPEILRDETDSDGAIANCSLIRASEWKFPPSETGDSFYVRFPFALLSITDPS